MALSHIYCSKLSFETFDVISVWLLLCCKSFKYCVCQHYRSRDDTCTEIWPFEVGSLQDGIRAHADCRMRPLRWAIRHSSLLISDSSPLSTLLMADPRNKFAQPNEDTPFGRHLKEVTRYQNIGIPSFTRTYTATLPEEERWMIRVQVLGRTFSPTSKPMEFSFEAPTWTLGKSMAAHITMGRIGEVYNNAYTCVGNRREYVLEASNV